MMDPKPIYMLRRGQCRFPVTPDEVPSHLFCAEPVEREGVVYCAEHAAICYDRRPASVRRFHAERAALARAALKPATIKTQKQTLSGYSDPRTRVHRDDEDAA
jgi:hypothetical protein